MTDPKEVSAKITCKNCSRENVLDWNGNGLCITCTRDAVLGSKQPKPPISGELEKVAAWMESLGFMWTDQAQSAVDRYPHSAWVRKYSGLIVTGIQAEMFYTELQKAKEAARAEVLDEVEEKVLTLKVINHAACAFDGSYHDKDCARQTELQDKMRQALRSLRSELREEHPNV
jgi:hypothetical protein